MKRLLEKLKYVFEFYSEEIICYTMIAILVVLVVVVTILFITGNLNTSGDFNATRWVANPANPASPLHLP